jgi:hypothetical protein
MFELQAEMYQVITNGLAYDAAPLMARIALNIGHNASEFPVDLSELLRIAHCPRDSGTTGFNELLIADYVRSAMLGALEPWSEDEVRELMRVAAVAPKAKLHLLVPGREA